MDKAEQQALFKKLQKLDTEQRNAASKEIDLADPLTIARMINEEDKRVAHQVEQRLQPISEAISTTAVALSNGGRLIYAGAGTSGRLGVIDAAECPPTFGSNPSEVQGLMAGGKEAMFVAQEGAEDKIENGVLAVDHVGLTEKDVLCGIAASGRTPFVLGAVREARRRGAKTLFLCTVPASQTDVTVDVMIDIPVGPEVIMGSTRMKSATAQKMVLNMITTGAMVRRGKVLENVMVDLMPTNQKLEERSKRIVMMFTGMNYSASEKLLRRADGHVKTALLMALGEVDKARAEALLAEHNGFIRKALIALGKQIR